MDLNAGASWIAVPIQIFCLDVLLGADNAVAIALACRSLHPADRRKGLALGAGAAVVLRILMAVGASFLLSAPYLKMIGALILIAVAIGLIRRDGLGAPEVSEADGALTVRRTLWSAALTIAIVDAAMSFDNVVALAAIARGNFWLLAAGVLLSIPVLAFGSLILVALLRNHPALVAMGCGLLGWIAGDMAISDPALADWANAQAPALVFIAPALGAVFVLAEAWFAAGSRENYPGAAERAGRDLAALPRARSSNPQLALRSPKIAASAQAIRGAIGVAPPVIDAAARKGAVVRPAGMGATRDDRIMLIGLVLLFLMAAVMIGFVMYMVRSYAVERFS